MKDKKTTNKVTQCEDGNPDCFHTPEPAAHYLDTKCPSCGLLSCEEPYVHKDSCHLFPKAPPEPVEVPYVCDHVPEHKTIGACLEEPVEECICSEGWKCPRCNRVMKYSEQVLQSLLAQERERQKREMLSVLRRVMEDFEDGHYPSADVVDTVESLLKS